LKKQLLTLSALSLAAIAAQAQSSVTAFGVIDVNLAYGTGSIANRTQLFRGGESTPRLGFRGEEDLGGGMKAGFWLQVNPDDGTGSPTNTNNQASGNGPALAGGQGLVFARRSTVSLSNSWGEIRLGRDIVPSYWGLVRGDLFGNVGVGSAVLYTGIIAGDVKVRTSNMLSYFTPNIGGFSAEVSHWLGENASGAATSGDGTGSGVDLNYGAGPLKVSASWGRTDYATGDIVQSNLHAAYDFGVARVVATISRDSAGSLKANGTEVGVAVPVGVGLWKAEYSNYRKSVGGVGSKYAFGYVHNLSKRTAVYATVASLSNSNGAAYALNSAITAVNTTSTGYDLGIRHSF
jgi:predicted porin